MQLVNLTSKLIDKQNKLIQNSYYEASVVRAPACQMLHGRKTADVCIVGGGYAGVSAALELAERGYAVILLEAQRVGWGASGRNGGQVIVGYGFGGEDTLEAQFPAEDARRTWNISVEGLQLVQERIATHHIDCDYVPGYLSLAVNARKMRSLAARVEHMAHAYGYHMQNIAPKDMGQWIESKRFCAGAFDPKSGHLHPLKYCLGLAKAAQRAGVQIFENSAVRTIARGGQPIVTTQSGEVVCDIVVLAGNVDINEYSKTLAPELSQRIMPVGTYMIASSPMTPERANRLIRHRCAVTDTNHVLDYFRVSADHRLLFGGGENFTTAIPRNLAQRMRKRMLAVFPQLADLSVAHVWGGYVDVSMNLAPDFGRFGHNIYYLQGFSGHGLALAGMAGKLVAESISGQAERFDLLSRIRHHAFPGGKWMRNPTLMLGMLYHQLRDLL